MGNALARASLFCENSLSLARAYIYMVYGWRGIFGFHGKDVETKFEYFLLQKIAIQISQPMKFAEHSGLNLYATNEEVLKKWDEQDLFHRSMTEREGCPSFVFFEGPPSANGHPGIHHVMARTIKDVFCRYKTMQGFQVSRKAGWDTHGLPVEFGVVKDLFIT